MEYTIIFQFISISKFTNFIIFFTEGNCNILKIKYGDKICFGEFRKINFNHILLYLLLLLL